MSLNNKSNKDLSIFIENEEDGANNDEAEKVEQSLRDFIGKIIIYYEKYNINNTILAKYEQKISQAETWLEVFDVMKEMFDELMENVIKNQ